LEIPTTADIIMISAEVMDIRVSGDQVEEMETGSGSVKMRRILNAARP
jgi:hypothetical protein